MLGIATQFEILRLTRERLEASSDPKLKQIAQVIKDNPVFAHLGAIGPALGDFIPSDPPPDPTKDPNPYALLWKMVFGLIGGDPGFFSVLSRIRHILDRLDQIARDEDCDALEAIRDGKDPDIRLEDIQGEAEKLQKLVGELDPASSPTLVTIGDIIGNALRPNVCTANPADPVPAPDTWQVRDFLHWKHPGRFIRALIETAGNAGDKRLLAYAYGYVVSYAGDVCGSPFLDSATGGPSRTQWWRQRLVGNFTDAWVFGFYNSSPRPTMTGDQPTPPDSYAAWPGLCAANLQKRIELAAPDPANLMQLVKTAKPFPENVLPLDFAQLWMKAFEAAYPGPRPPLVKAEALNGAYLMTWLLLWFRTSGEVLGCDLTAPPEPTGGCGKDPSELDPFSGIGSGGGPTPPPEMDTDLEDTAAEVCGILLAILGGLLILTGNAAAGAGAIAGAVALLDCSSVVEWEKLRCELFWYRMYLFNGVQGLHKILSLASLDYPYSSDLAEDQAVLSVLPGVQFESGRNLVKSKGRDQDYPSKPWDGSLLSFNQRPTASSPGFETPRTLACLDAVFPSFWIDDDVNNPLSNGDVKTGGSFPMRTKPTGGPLQFGNAVANAVDLFSNLGNPLPDWNLDADRGLAFLTWQFQQHYNPDAVQIEPEP
jgi:hypothetical protein